MTIKEAILKVLEEQKCALTYLEVHDQIIEKKYIDWGKAKTPSDTIGAYLGDFIRKSDTRVKRVKGKKGFEYYLSKYEADINLTEIVEDVLEPKETKKSKIFQERDLHKLFSSFLNSQNVYSKTIFHEKSTGNDNHQKWIHPDMVGVNFLNLQTKVSQKFLNAINREDTFKITSYELKKEINTDYELKKTFFQAVSNSSWANYGYLIAFEISDSLDEEMERLNQSFGIGIIELKSNPFESRILYPARYKNLDFKTIDKLCKINPDFEKFIDQVEKLLAAEERYVTSTKLELEQFCDSYFTNDTEIVEYCKKKNIPIEKNTDNTRYI